MNQKQMLEEELKKLDTNYQIERQELLSKIEHAEKFIPTNPTKEETELATQLHEELCHMDHTEMCGWFYYPDDWSSYERSKYLRMARKLMERYDSDALEEVKFIIKAIRE